MYMMFYSINEVSEVQDVNEDVPIVWRFFERWIDSKFLLNWKQYSPMETHLSGIVIVTRDEL